MRTEGLWRCSLYNNSWLHGCAVCWGLRALIVVGLALLFAGCGSVTFEGGADASAPELVAHEAGALEAAAGDVVDACPPTTLSCTSQAGACPQGQAVARRSTCGGPIVAVCCPVNDCELTACEACPLCVP